MAPRSNDARLRDRAIAKLLPAMPRGLVRRLSSPYIAGETLDEALRVIERLCSEGFTITLDVLGESITSEQQAHEMTEQYLHALDALAGLGNTDLVNVSVKLTAIGLALDRQFAHDNLAAIVERAGQHGGFVRIDMEDTPWTDVTLELYRELRAKGHDNVGVVIQAYLRRSEDDVRALIDMGARVRVVKGIYLEPEHAAYTDMPTINLQFRTLCTMLFMGKCHTAIATHDDALVATTQQLIEAGNVPNDNYEYQMLLGVREWLRDEIRDAGHPVRIYVPYGAQWYEYSLRRLRENPTIAGYVAADVLRTMRAKLTRSNRRAGRAPS